jgi:group I intron endonuclease
MAKKRDKPSHNKVPLLAELLYFGSSKKGGIYQIIHKINNRRYVGSTQRFEDRWNTHLRELRSNKHHNKFLQNDFNKSGEASFRFEIVEIVDGDKTIRQEREQFYLDRLFEETVKDSNTRYNHSSKAIITEPRNPKTRSYRTDWYWFLSPDGIEYVVENLSEFCSQNKHHRPSMSLVSLGQLQSYKGWTRISISKNNNVVSMKTGEEVSISSVSEFSRTYHVDQSHLSKMLAGKRKSCGDWIVKNRILVPRSHKGKVYWLVSPDGLKTKVNNLDLFARTHNLDVSCLRRVLDGKDKQHKGWLRFGMTQEQLRNSWNKRYDQMAKTYNMLNPEGQLVEIHNMTKFCRENNLVKSHMIAVSKGKLKSHKGWTNYSHVQTVE